MSTEWSTRSALTTEAPAGHRLPTGLLMHSVSTRAFPRAVAVRGEVLGARDVSLVWPSWRHDEVGRSLAEGPRERPDRLVERAGGGAGAACVAVLIPQLADARMRASHRRRASVALVRRPMAHPPPTMPVACIRRRISALTPSPARPILTARPSNERRVRSPREVRCRNGWSKRSRRDVGSEQPSPAPPVPRPRRRPSRRVGAR